ncbi:DUF418 domain-containing protein [Saccharomonospora sp. NPDC046836]|uniref:DUF418 domain-containing protein n=1 Tax=Saccharomonospora sp. NPDC046836 TaxID=3156921 RepID=UPI0033EA76E5
MRTRQLAPDVARGVALCFIAIANVMLYLHDRPYGLRQHLVEDGTLDRAVTFATVSVVDARVYPLFALLLGYGIARLHEQDPGAAGVRRLRRRGTGLVLFGAAHGILLFSGDILGLYGLLTLALIPVLRWPDRRLLVVAALLALPCALVQGIALADPGPTLQRSILWSIGIADPLEALAWRPLEWGMGMFGMLGVLPAVLLGVWAGRRDLLASPAVHRRLLVRCGLVGSAVGVVGGLPAALVASGVVTLDAGLTAAAISTLHVVTGIAGGIGYAALVSMVCTARGFASSRLAHAFAAVGQRSLTCYLLQTALMTPLLAAWTLAWGGVLGSAGALFVALAVYAFTVCAALWMRRQHDIRPAERLLRNFATVP